MASPQTEDGFTKIANELLDALCRLHIAGNEWSYVHAVIRKTYGYNKKEDWVTNTQIALLTGMNKVRVSEAKNKLLELQIVTENRNKISLQKDYTKWGQLRKTVTKVTENRNSELRKTVSTKDNITKDKQTKDTSTQGVQKNHSMENLIPEVIKLFEGVDPKNKTYYGNKTQRGACQFLLDEYGFEEVRRRIEVLPRTNTMQYFPSITTPCQLKDKWVTLNNQIQRHKLDQQSKSNLVAF